MSNIIEVFQLFLTNFRLFWEEYTIRKCCGHVCVSRSVNSELYGMFDHKIHIQKCSQMTGGISCEESHYMYIVWRESIMSDTSNISVWQQIQCLCDIISSPTTAPDILKCQSSVFSNELTNLLMFKAMTAEKLDGIPVFSGGLVGATGGPTGWGPCAATMLPAGPFGGNFFVSSPRRISTRWRWNIELGSSFFFFLSFPLIASVQKNSWQTCQIWQDCLSFHVDRAVTIINHRKISYDLHLV